MIDYGNEKDIYPSFTVSVVSLVDQHELDEEDTDVEGDYEYTLPPHSSGWTTSRHAKEVLDAFHDSVAISVLEDFEISVYNSTGEEIYEEDEDV